MTTNRRPTDAVTGLTRTRQSQGDGTMAGRAKIATPHDTSRLRQASGSVIANKPLPQGQCITLAAVVDVPDGGGPVEFDTIIDATRHGFGNVTVPITDIPCPLAGVTGVSAELEWLDVDHDSDWKGEGGSLSLLRDGTEFDQWNASGTPGLPARWIEPMALQVPFDRGGKLTVVTSQQSGATQRARVKLSWGIQDPSSIIAVDPPPPPPIVQLAGNASGSGSATMAVPDNVEVGDRVFATAYQGHTGNITPPGSWTLWSEMSSPLQNYRLRAWEHVVTAGDLALDDWTWTGSSSQGVSVVCVVVKGTSTRALQHETHTSFGVRNNAGYNDTTADAAGGWVVRLVAVRHNGTFEAQDGEDFVELYKDARVGAGYQWHPAGHGSAKAATHTVSTNTTSMSNTALITGV
jgi:hypothetical protein